LTPQTLWIPGKLPGLNELIKAAKSGRGKYNAYSRLKHHWTEKLATLFVLSKIKRRKSVYLSFSWCEKTRRRDPDNIAAGGRKLILDALVRARVIRDDGWKQIRGWEDTFETSHKEGVWLKIE
jgi:Holliday junction resolvase RusA-like endonuclease